MTKSVRHPISNLECIIKLVISKNEPAENYKKGLIYLQGKVDYVEESVKSIELYSDEFKDKALKLKNRFKGDISRASRYLFNIYKSINNSDDCDSHRLNLKYLKAFLCWAYTSQECINSNMMELRK